jgi:DNA-binding transcriptional MerR regulator
MMSPLVALQLYEPESHLFYSIETAARLSHVSRRMIAVYCQHGLVSPVMDPASGGWFFNDDGIRRLRRIEYLREACGMNLSAMEMILGLLDEVEELRREVRFLRQQ